MDDVDAVVQILAEALLEDGLLELAVARRDEAGVEGDLDVGSHRPHLPLLQGAEQLRLQGKRQLSDLIEEERPAVRLDEQPVRAPLASVKAPRA